MSLQNPDDDYHNSNQSQQLRLQAYRLSRLRTQLVRFGAVTEKIQGFNMGRLVRDIQNTHRGYGQWKTL